MDVKSQVAKFFDNSPKRQEALREKSMEQVQLCTKKKHLLDLCQTQWIYRHTALEHFYEVVVDVSTTGWNKAFQRSLEQRHHCR